MRYAIMILACVILYAAAMEAVRAGAYWLVGSFGAIAGFAVIAAMYGAARLYEGRQERSKVEILPPR